LGALLLAELDEQLGAVTRPLEESERRIEVLRAAADDAAGALRDLDPLFKAEEGALASDIEAARRRFLTAAEPRARDALAEAVERLQPGTGAIRERIADLARSIAKAQIEAWASEFEPHALRRYQHAMVRFVALRQGILERLRSSGEPAFSGVQERFSVEPGFRTRRGFHFHDLLAVAAPGAVTQAIDVLRPRGALVAAARRDAQRYLERLLATNSARLANDLTDRVRESRRQLETELIHALRETTASCERSLDQARLRHEAGAEALQEEHAKVRGLREHAQRLLRPR
jgi:hypothetical protein